MTVGAIGELGGSKLHVDPAASDEDARRWIADFGGNEIQTLVADAAGRGEMSQVQEASELVRHGPT